MILRSPLPAVDVPPVPVSDIVLRHARRHPDKAALIDGPTGRIITYGELDAGIRSLAGGLVSWGLATGDVVAVLAPNVPEYAVVFHAVASAGGIVTTINPGYTEREIRHQLTDAAPRLLVTVAGLLDVARHAAAGTSVEQLVVFDEGAGVADDAVPLSALSGDPLDAPVPIDPGAAVALPYSSGTTGLSKGVVLTHRNLVANIVQVLAAFGMRADETAMCVLPMFHIYGMQIIMNTTLAAGATVVTMPRFDLAEFLELHARHRITRSYIAPRSPSRWPSTPSSTTTTCRPWSSSTPGPHRSPPRCSRRSPPASAARWCRATE